MKPVLLHEMKDKILTFLFLVSLLDNIVWLLYFYCGQNYNLFVSFIKCVYKTSIYTNIEVGAV